jgi:DNA-binding transcriptional LysR family regulator
MPYMTCATPDYLKRHGAPKTPADLLDGHQVVSYFSSRTGRYIPPRYERGDERIEINGHAVIAVNESTAHLSALLAGLGMAQTFAFMAQPHVESGALVELLADWEPPPMPVSVAYPSSRHPSAKLRAFVDWAVEVFAPYGSVRRR